MVDFYRRALKKLDKLDTEQRRELLVSAVTEISLFENVLDSIDKGIIVCDVEYNLIMANKCAQRLIPMNCTEGIKLNAAIRDELLVETFRDILLNRERVTDREVDVEYQGRSRLLSVNVVPLVHDRHITGTLIYMEDITEKRRVESRLRRAENLASLTTLAAGVAHEIKNPLGSISIHLQLLQKTLAKKNKSSDKAMDKYFDVLKEEVYRLNRIVVDFLFAVRPMALELREGDINALVTKIVEFVRLEMEQSHILCLLELDENLPKVLMDERYMKQAILNLVTNARAAMPDGGVFTIATNRMENEIQILICDTGIGISRENLVKIFDPYFTTKETGTGLGLTQVYKIIREHQGEISVDAAPGEGTEFEIILPVPRRETRMIAFNEGDLK
ncbi:MAG: ATP-binding protein [Treponema sp.]|nr:ATP-binding protein [Treponema sp.]